MVKKLIVLLFLLPFMSVQAQRPDAPPFAQPGNYSVGVTEIIIEDDERPLNMTMWYPADLAEDAEFATYSLSLLSLDSEVAVANAPVAEGPFPLVVFSHGSGGYRYQSLWLTEHLASWGFVVIAADHPTNTLFDQMSPGSFEEDLASNYVYRPQDVIRQLDFVETLTAADGDYPGLIDMEQVAVMGHSFGGYTALAVAGAELDFNRLDAYCDDPTTSERLAASVCFLQESENEIADLINEPATENDTYIVGSDPRVDAVIALAPWNGPILNESSLAAIDMPALILVGTGDRVTIPERDAFTMFDDLTNAERTLGTFAYGDHYIFVDECFEAAINLGFFSSCSDRVWDMARVHDISNHLITAFLLDTFYDDAEATNAIDEADFPGVDITPESTDSVAYLVPEVIAQYPHDTNAFTQGFLLADGVIYESTGMYGASTLRSVDVTTGEVIQSVPVPAEYFAEGLALVDDRLLQLTWQENTLFTYDREGFQQLENITYTGEGWGLCYDGSIVYHSDGSATIDHRDPVTFDLLETITVTLDGMPIPQLNELECVGDVIYANVWQTDQIVRFDKQTGVIDTVIDASGLLTEEESRTANVLNGIAYDAENDEFLITGKYWPWVFRVEFVPSS